MAKQKKRPTERTLEWLRKRGAMAAVVERWNPHVKIRQDMFGLVDVVALWPSRTDFIQCCGVDVASHIVKIQSSVDLQARLRALLADPSRRFYIVAWRKRELKGKRPEWVRRILRIDESVSVAEIIDSDF